MKTLIALFVFLSGVGFAQIAPVSTIQTAGGFLDVCGSPDTQLSAAQLATLKKGPPSEFTQTLKSTVADRTAEMTMCLGYLAGLIEGWKEGHEHGVAAAQFPNGWPDDEKKALAALPLTQLHAANAAMNLDVPCIPDYVTVAEERDIVAKFIRKNTLLTVAFTSRVVWLAFREAFPCSAHSSTAAH